MIIDETTLSGKIYQEIDCVGCVDSLHTFLKALAHIAKNNGGEFFFERCVIYPDRSIGKKKRKVEDKIFLSAFSEEKIGDIQQIANLLHYHKNNFCLAEDFIKSLNIKKRNDGHLHRGKVLSRCLLHSKKPIPFGKKNIRSFIKC